VVVVVNVRCGGAGEEVLNDVVCERVYVQKQRVASLDDDIPRRVTVSEQTKVALLNERPMCVVQRVGVRRRRLAAVSPLCCEVVELATKCDAYDSTRTCDKCCRASAAASIIRRWCW